MQNKNLIHQAEDQLKIFGKFVDLYDRKLQNYTVADNSYLVKCNKAAPPTFLKYSGTYENLPLPRLIESDNKLLNKILLTFSHLCQECQALEAECSQSLMKFLFQDEELCAFREGNADDGRSTEKCFVKMSESMEFLYEIKLLTQHCILVANNILHQCGAFLTHNKLPFVIHFPEVFQNLSRVLVQMVKFDEVLSRSNYQKCWSGYKKTISSVSGNMNRFPKYSEGEMNGLLNVLNELDFLFTGSVFQNFLDSTFMIKDKIQPKAFAVLSTQLQDYIKTVIQEVDKFPQDLCDFIQTETFVKANALVVLFHLFSGQMDNKSFRILLDHNAKQCSITLIGNLIWYPEQFLYRHAETLLRHNPRHYQKDLSKVRSTYLNSKIISVQRESKAYCNQLVLWFLDFKNAIDQQFLNNEVRSENFKDITTKFIEGLKFAGQLSHLVKSLMNLHATLKVSMSKPTLMAICKCIELLKLVQGFFADNVDIIARVFQSLIQYLQHKSLYLVVSARKKLSVDKNNDKRLDVISSLRIVERCLAGPPTKSRLIVINLAMDSANFNSQGLITDFYDKFKKTLRKLQILGQFQEDLKHVCDSSFIYWHQSLLSAYLKQVVEKKIDFESFEKILQAFNESGRAMENLDLTDSQLTKIFKDANYQDFKKEIVALLCGEIEVFLRLDVHSNLQLIKPNPFEKGGLKDIRDLIDIDAFELNGRHLVLRDHIDNYLSNMFYNLTTISLHDWKSYEEMRQLSTAKLSLHPIKDYLPNKTIEQGVDILEIMRNIQVFVTKYMYNMNTQIFVEQTSPNKHLNTIGIRHIANSLQTHGSGIINTAINFTYQFLRQKIYAFSQFLYDEQVKSRLMKEFRYTSEHQNEEDFMYGYERADNFNKEMRKLGLSEDGQTFMDLFRKTISHIGNAMGYIRMIRSGNMHANYNATLYLPNFDEDLFFVDMSKEGELRDITLNAAENLEDTIHHLYKSFSDSSDYFKILMEAFLPFCRNDKNIHLKTFFLIIPALTLNYVEHMLTSKDKIQKRDKQEAILFDDGFIMGIVYLLKLLDQNTDFNSLQWFESLSVRFRAELKKIEELRLKAAKTDEKLQQTLSLTEKRIKTYKSEYKWLYFSLNSAKIFFQ